MDRLYDMLVQVRCLPTKNKSSLGKSDNFYMFHKEMEHNINACEEFHQEVTQMITCGLLQIEKEEKDDVVGLISF
jgi:hypothetical protein